MGVASNSDSLKNYANRSGIDTELKNSSQVYMPDSGYSDGRNTGQLLLAMWDVLGLIIFLGTGMQMRFRLSFL